jgi:putative endonuclease
VRSDDVIVVRMWFVYILRCADNSLYIGETGNLESRLHKHHDGSACSFTASRRPVILAYSERHSSRDAALQRERQLKRWTRAKKEALIAGDLPRLKAL